MLYVPRNLTPMLNILALVHGRLSEHHLSELPGLEGLPNVPEDGDVKAFGGNVEGDLDWDPFDLTGGPD